VKLRKLKEIIDGCVVRAEDCDPDVEVWFKKSYYDIREIGQFGVVPDVTITIGKKLGDTNTVKEFKIRNLKPARRREVE